MAKTSGVGLDIGTSSVKIVELQALNGNVLGVKQFGMVPLEDGALNGGIVKDPLKVAMAVKEILLKNRIKLRRAVVAIAGQAVVVRHIKMPLMTDSELASAIKWEAERYIPFPIDEVTMDYQLIQRDTQQNEMEVMIVCAHNDIIYSHLEVLKEANVTPLAMDIQPFSLMRTFGLETGTTSGNVALLDIGAGTSDLTIVKDEVPRFTRIIPIAGTRFTQMIMNSFNLNFAEAEKAKINLSDAMFDPNQGGFDDLAQQLNFCMAEGLKELVLELRRSFDYYSLQQRNEEINKLIISGGGSKIKNLADYLYRQFNLPVEIGRPQRKYSCNERLRTEFETYFPHLAVAFGLALREVIAA